VIVSYVCPALSILLAVSTGIEKNTTAALACVDYLPLRGCEALVVMIHG